MIQRHSPLTMKQTRQIHFTYISYSHYPSSFGSCRQYRSLWWSHRPFWPHHYQLALCSSSLPIWPLYPSQWAMAWSPYSLRLVKPKELHHCHLYIPWYLWGGLVALSRPFDLTWTSLSIGRYWPSHSLALQVPSSSPIITAPSAWSKSLISGVERGSPYHHPLLSSG